MPGISQRLASFYGDGTGPERCGLILKRSRIIETPNASDTPDASYEIPADLVLKHLPSIVGTWHTHPGQPANLSHEDYVGFTNWPKLRHFIIGKDGVREFRVDATGMVLNA